MDPLSITASAIAILGAVQQAGKCVQKLKAIREAPHELNLLLEEVVDLCQLLEHVKTAQKPPDYSEDEEARGAVPTERPKGLDWQISRTSTKLGELDQLIQHHSSRVHRRKLDFGWVRGRQKANALRADLKLLRLNIAASLSATTSETVSRVESAIERVSTEQVKATQLLTALVRGIPPVQDCSETPPLEVCSEDGSLNCTFQCSIQSSKKKRLTSVQPPQYSSKMTRHPIRTRKADRSEEIKQPMRLYAKRPNGACEPWCSCACHAKTVLKLKQPDVVGSFSVAYSGLPWVTAGCDQKSCRSRSIPSVAVTVQFPNWFWKRYWSSSFSYTAIRGPEINVKIPRTVSWVSELWRHGVDGNLRAVQDLFSQGLASPWDVQALGGSLLHYATDHGHWKLCKFLVEQGAILENEDSFNNSPASLAWGKVLAGFLTEDQESMVANMFKDTDYLQTRQFTILHKIVLRLIPRTIESELAYSTRDLDAVDSLGRTCISWAAERGDAVALKTLLQYDANVDLPDGQGNTPLHYVRNSTCVDILLAAGADITARNSFGHTPLHMVCRGAGSLSLLKRVIEAGIDINATDNSGETALCTATFGKHVECALYLIQRGADVDIANGTNGLGDGPIHMTVISDVPAVLKLLLASDANYTRVNLFGRTILHYAAGLVCEETIQVLTSHGLQDIDVSIRDSDGKTAEDLLNERGDDDSNPDFKVKFHELLDTIAAVQNPASPKVIEINEPDLKVSAKAALDILKDGSGIRLTPLSSGQENDDYEDDEFYEDSYDTHGAPMFYDALEEVTETLRVVDVTV